LYDYVCSKGGSLKEGSPQCWSFVLKAQKVKGKDRGGRAKLTHKGTIGTGKGN